MDPVELTPVGTLRADFKQKFGTPRQGSLARHSRARVELAPRWRGRGILSGLEGFSHVWLITHLHLSDNSRVRGKVHPPRLRGAKVGILASRSPHRPNNIGLTLARIEGVTGDVLELSEVDLVDGTPIFDLKPYLAEADRPAEYKDGWTATLEPRAECTTIFTAEAESDLAKFGREPARTRALIVEMLALDPRPPAYLARENARFAIWVEDLNVVLSFNAGVFTVVRVERTAPSGPRPGDGPRPAAADTAAPRPRP